MFNLSDIPTRLLAFAERMFSDPTHATRVVIASFATVGVMAAGVNSGGLASSLLSARLVEPVSSVEEAQQIAAAAQANAASCSINQALAKQTLEGFENSFRGILPGAGKLLNEHVTTVAERKEKLILEVIARYASYKYCVTRDEIRLAIGSGNFSQFNLSAYNKVTLGPKSNAASIDASDIINNDLRQTYTYVAGIVENAIAAAQSTDNQTESRLASLGSQTNADLAARDLGIANSANAIGNIQTQVLGEISKILYDHTELLADSSKLLDKIANIKGHEHALPNPTKGHGDPKSEIDQKMKYDDFFFDQEIKADKARAGGFATPNVGKQVETLIAPQAGLKAAATATDAARAEADASVGAGSVSATKDPAFTYGLLNLVKSDDREKFLSTRLDAELKIYTATRMFVNPLTPGSGLMNNTQAIAMPDIQACNAIDNADGSGSCFGAN